MKNAVKKYNEIMYSICCDHLTIGTRFSEGTQNWNLRDMVSEMQYTLDLWNESTSTAYADAHDPNQPNGKPWYRNWVNEKNRMKRFIEKYKNEALKMSCTESHFSKFD